MIVTTLLEKTQDITSDYYPKTNAVRSKNVEHSNENIKKTEVLEKSSKIEETAKEHLKEEVKNQKEAQTKMIQKEQVIDENDMKSFLYMMVPGMARYFENARGKIVYKSEQFKADDLIKDKEPGYFVNSKS